MSGLDVSGAPQRFRGGSILLQFGAMCFDPIAQLQQARRRDHERLFVSLFGCVRVLAIGNFLDKIGRFHTQRMCNPLQCIECHCSSLIAPVPIQKRQRDPAFQLELVPIKPLLLG